MLLYTNRLLSYQHDRVCCTACCGSGSSTCYAICHLQVRASTNLLLEIFSRKHYLSAVRRTPGRHPPQIGPRYMRAENSMFGLYETSSNIITNSCPPVVQVISSWELLSSKLSNPRSARHVQVVRDPQAICSTHPAAARCFYTLNIDQPRLTLHQQSHHLYSLQWPKLQCQEHTRSLSDTLSQALDPTSCTHVRMYIYLPPSIPQEFFHSRGSSGYEAELQPSSPEHLQGKGCRPGERWN